MQYGDWLLQISGYDSCAHLSEETRSADRNAAAGIMLAVGLSVILGFFYALALLFSIQVISASCLLFLAVLSTSC